MITTAAPPSAIESEICVLGGMLINPEAVHVAGDVLRDEMFYREAHRRIFRAVQSLALKGDGVDVMTVGAELRALGDLDGIGGLEYLAELVEAVPTAANIEVHAKIIREKAVLRRVITAAQETIRQASAPDADPETLLTDAQARLLTAHSGSRRGYVSAGSAVMDVMGEIEQEVTSGKKRGLRTGVPKLDYLTGGLQAGDMVVLAARPSMGKTALALQIGIRAAREGSAVLVASLEMTTRQLVRRGICSIARMSVEEAARDFARSSAKLAEAATEIHRIPLYVDDQPGETAEALRAGIMRAAAKNPPALLIIDYLQLLEGKGENRVQQVSQISRSLKLLGRDLGCPVLALSQLNRRVEERHPPRPILSDLRDSGAVEQDADVVLLLWRPEYYFDERTKDDTRKKWEKRAELIVAKQRNGPTGSIRLLWDGPATTFMEEEAF